VKKNSSIDGTLEPSGCARVLKGVVNSRRADVRMLARIRIRKIFEWPRNLGVIDERTMFGDLVESASGRRSLRLGTVL